MAELVLFFPESADYVYEVLMDVPVKHYRAECFEAGFNSNVDVTGEKLAFIGGLNILVQFAEPNKYRHLYIVDNWTESKSTITQLSDHDFIAVELTGEQREILDKLAIQHMFYESVNSSMLEAKFPEYLLHEGDAFSTLARDINNNVEQICKSQLQQMADNLAKSIRDCFTA